MTDRPQGTMLQTSAQLEMLDRARTLSARYAHLDALRVLEETIKREFPHRIGLVSSFGTESAVLLHMVQRIDPYLPVIFLETGKHFPETRAYRDTLMERLGLCNIQIVSPRPASVRADDPAGDLHARDPDLCCHVRKTLPMLAALRGLKCWITGRKRGQAATRADITLFETQDRWIKLNPLLDWRADDLTDYMARHDLPPHPLRAQGYPSVGCAPCTRAVEAGEDARAGRWADRDKTECGIHFENGKMVRR